MPPPPKCVILRAEANVNQFHWRRSHFALIFVLIVIALILLGRFLNFVPH